HGAYDRLFCGESGNGSRNRCPCMIAQTKSKRCEENRDGSAEHCQKTVGSIFHCAKASVNKSISCQEPHHDTCQKQDRTGFHNKSSQALPYMKKNCFCLRNMVCRKFHNERSRLAVERLCLFQNDRRNKNCHDSDHIHNKGKSACRESGDLASDHTAHQ